MNCAKHRQPHQSRNGAHVQGGVEVEERLERRARGWQGRPLPCRARPRAEHAVKHRANAQHPHGTHRRGHPPNTFPAMTTPGLMSPSRCGANGVGRSPMNVYHVRYRFKPCSRASSTDEDVTHASSISGSPLRGMSTATTQAMVSVSTSPKGSGTVQTPSRASSTQPKQRPTPPQRPPRERRGFASLGPHAWRGWCRRP